ncbi:MAG: alpha/beta fold hydrolase [Deltaproteobacteria bacterium]|nr:alpha/beta fold hydrolase [Deltaproteobacteria bacterium]
MRPSALALLLAVGCRPDPFVAVGPEEAWHVVDPEGAPIGEAGIAPGENGGWVAWTRAHERAALVWVQAAPGTCARREQVGRTVWEASVDADAWSWRRGLERRGVSLGEPPAACLAEFGFHEGAGWRTDLLPWRTLLPELPIEPGDRRTYRVVDLATGRLLDLWVEAREHLDVIVDGAPVPSVRAFAHTAAEGRVLWYTADRVRLLAVETPLERARLEREGVVLPPEPVPEPPAGVEEILWVVETPTQRLAGTLARPQDAKRPLPVVVLIAGSGAVDRDGDAGGLATGIQRTLAWHLAGRGLAVLRYDKRGVGGSVSLGQERSSTLQDLAADVRTWMDNLVALPGLDPRCVLLVGHSEGGYLAPLVAGEDPRVRAVVLLAGPASRLDEIMRAQLRLLLEAHGADEATIERAARRQEATLAVVASGRDREILLPGWGSEAADWLYSHLAHDPETTLEAVRVPLLALFGRQDLQVPVEEATRMEAILAGSPESRVVVLDGLDHLLMPVTGSPGMGAYADPDRTVDPRVLDLVAEFLTRAGIHPPEAGGVPTG